MLLTSAAEPLTFRAREINLALQTYFMQFRARFIDNIIQFAAYQGVDTDYLVSLTGKTRADLQQEDLYFDAPIYNQIIEEAVRLSGDRNFGLHLGEFLSLSAAGLIVQIVQSSQTVAEAIQHLVQFANLGCQALPFKQEQEGPHFQVSMTPAPVWLNQSPEAVQQTIDGVVLFTLRQLDALTQHKHQPLLVEFGYPAPSDTWEYERILKSPFRFGASKTSIHIHPSNLKTKVVGRDYRLLQVLVELAQNRLAEMEGSKGFEGQVKQTIINLMNPDLPLIEEVAANLNMSLRSFQRKLKKEGYTYKQLTENVRKEFAREYLQNEELSIKEIAYLLNYAETSSFSRSFKRWFGVSPERYRLQIT